MFTGLLIALIVAAGASVVGGGLYVAAKRRQVSGEAGDQRQLGTSASGQLLERTVHDLRTGDIIQYDARDYLVEGVVAYDEDGHHWSAGRIVDGKSTLWLVAGMERLGAKASLRILTPDQDMEMSGYPAEKIVAGTTRFELDTRGTALAKFSGDVGALPGKRGDPSYDTVERCRWWRYESAGEDTMIIEQWSGEYRVLRGRKVEPMMIEMIPGS
jgi:hypothetical protein